MWRKTLACVTLAAAALAGAAPAIAQQPKVVVAQATDAFIFLPAYIARAKNYFAQEGLDGSVTIYRGGVEALASVISGSSHVYLGPPATAMKAIVKGQDVKVYGAVLSQVPTNIVIQGDAARKKNVSASSPVTERIKALKGLTMGINAPGSASDQILRYTIRLGGMDPATDVKIVPVGGDSALVAAFEQRRIDGFAWPSPASDIAVKKFGGLMVVNYTKGEYEPMRGFLYVSLISRSDWLAKNPDTATRLVRAFTKAQKLINEKPEEARAALRTFFPNMDLEAFNDGFNATAAAVPASMRIDPRAVALNKRFSEEVENIKLDVNIENVFTNATVDAAEGKR